MRGLGNYASPRPSNFFTNMGAVRPDPPVLAQGIYNSEQPWVAGVRRIGIAPPLVFFSVRLVFSPTCKRSLELHCRDNVAKSGFECRNLIFFGFDRRFFIAVSVATIREPPVSNKQRTRQLGPLVPELAYRKIQSAMPSIRAVENPNIR